MIFSQLLLSAYYLFVGMGCPASKEGIQVYRFDSEKGTAEYVSGVSGLSYPTFQCVSPDGKRVYSVCEDQKGSAAAFLRYDRKQHTLTLEQTELTASPGPCHISLTPDGKLVATANYTGGTVSLFSVGSDGRLGPARVQKFSGSSIVEGRQEKPYLHATYTTPDHRYLMADDLGTDYIHLLPLRKGLLAEDFFLKAGAGPRHLCWAPDKKHAYVIGELSGEVFTLGYKKHRLELQQVLVADSLGAGGSADIHITRDGRFVYTSHRLRGDGVSILRVQPDGTLQKIGYQDTGTHPRNFTLSPDDRYLLVACRDTDEVEIYERDAKTGMLRDTGHRIHVSSPMCLQWLPR